jgi:hypothetical protein
MTNAGRARRRGGWGATAIACATATAGVMLSAAAVGIEPSRPQSVSSPHRAFLSRYCVGCHNDRQRTAGVSLDRVDLVEANRDRTLWEQVVRQVRSGTMPPAGSPRPERDMRFAFVSAAEAALDRTAEAAPDPGRPLLRRLTRTEYVNAVRDLLHLEIDAALLPADESHGGFDNAGASLSIAPALLERYLAAARRVSRLAVGDRSIGASFASRTYAAPPDVRQDVRTGDTAPLGSRGGLSVRHHFPLDGSYRIRLSLQRTVLGYIRGLGDRHHLEVRLDGRLLQRFAVGGENHGEPAPLSYAGLFAGSPTWEAYALSADANLSVRFSATAGTHTVSAAFIEKTLEDEGVLDPPLTGLGLSYNESRSAPSGVPAPAVHSISIEGPSDPTGPGDTASRRRIFTCRPEASSRTEPCAAAILATLAHRAYRGTSGERDTDVLLTFFKKAEAQEGFEGGIRAAVERALVDPKFLLRIEHDPPGITGGAPYRVTPLDLASRLSFFLWSSIPDDELLRSAASSTLSEPSGLEREVRRMLADTRSLELARVFAVQWLSLRRLQDVSPDPELFPDFDGNLRDAFQRETELLLEHQLHADGSVLELLSADYSFVNERLARFYGIPNVYGSHFRRVTLPAETRRLRGGLLGHGSILTLTSYPTRTSPVQRGRWLLENVLGTPPPPPPPDTPPFPAVRDGGAALSVRERTERHRTNPACASCHARMDPLGFALEGFDATGRWRVADEWGKPVDVHGVFPDGTRFAGIEGLRDMLLSRPDEFARTVAERLLAFALGRTLESSDMPAVRTIVREAAPAQYRWSSLIMGVVKSAPFQMKRSAL